MASKKKPKEFKLHGMTKHGAIYLWQFYKRTYPEIELISEPKQVGEGQWEIIMTKPKDLE